MAKTGENFSPKDWSCWIATDGAQAGSATGAHATNMYALDVDSVAYPTLNVTQALDVKTGGRFLRDDDFFQDNVLRTTEITLSGTLHNDSGHLLLLKNICNDYDVSNEITVTGSYAPPAVIYGTANAGDAADSLTLVVKAPNETTSKHLVFTGCVVTNFSITADVGTEGGRYKYSATLATGFKPDLDYATTVGANAYSNATDSFLSTASAHKFFSADVVMQNFTLTMDNPAVMLGAEATGYEMVARGTEFAITVDCQVKYDAQTDMFVNDWDGQTAADAADFFNVTNDGAFGISVPAGVVTNVAYSEGDIMMLDCSGKAVNIGSGDIVNINI
jgi:hypothetical protein